MNCSISVLKILILLVFIPCLEGKAQKIRKDNYSVTQNDIAFSNQYLQSGLVKYKLKDYDDALSDFERAIKYDSLNWRAYRGKGDVQQKLNHYAEAIGSYTRALSVNKNDTLSYKGRAESKRMNGSYMESLVDYNIALELDSKDAAMYFGRGSIFYRLSNYRQSIDDYSISIKILPRAAVFYLKRALAYVDNSQYLEGKRDLKKYLQLGGKEEGAYYYLGLCNLQLGEFDSSKTDSAVYYLVLYTQSKNKANGNDPSGYQLLGVAYSEKRDSAMARQNFRKSLSLDPENKDTYFRWGNAELNFGNYKKANELISEAYKRVMNPSADFYYHFGLAKTGIGDTTQAIKYFTKSLEIDSNKQDIYGYRASLLFFSNRYYKIVLSDLDHMIRLAKEDDERAEGHSLKSIINIRVKDTISAKVEIEKAIRLMPEEPLHYMVRALVNSTAGKGKETVLKDVDKAIRIDPTMTEAYLFKASYYALQGDHKNGCETVKRAIKIGATVPKEVENYICKGKKPKNGKVPDLSIPLTPRMKKIVPGFSMED